MTIEQVLLADDDDALRAALGEILSGLGFHVVEAADGPTALEVALRENIGFSILDYHMPGMTALEILRVMHGAQPNRQLPCILISAEASRSEQLAAMQLGAFRFLAKPFGVDCLVSCLRDVLHTFHPGPHGQQLIARLQRGLDPSGGDRSGPPLPLDLLFPFRRRPDGDGRSC